MDTASGIAQQIQTLEQLISLESERYENASAKNENLHSRLGILERIRILQMELDKLKAQLKV